MKKCRRCGSIRLSASFGRGSRWVSFVSVFGLRRFRCTFCGARFYSFGEEAPDRIGCQNPLLAPQKPGAAQATQEVIRELARMEARLEATGAPVAVEVVTEGSSAPPKGNVVEHHPIDRDKKTHFLASSGMGG